MMDTDQFWRYAKETMLAATLAKTDDEKQNLFHLAGTWTRAAMLMRASSNQDETAAV
jgi:hypothetical protein